MCLCRRGGGLGGGGGSQLDVDIPKEDEQTRHAFRSRVFGM